MGRIPFVHMGGCGSEPRRDLRMCASPQASTLPVPIGKNNQYNGKSSGTLNTIGSPAKHWSRKRKVGVRSTMIGDLDDGYIDLESLESATRHPRSMVTEEFPIRYGNGSNKARATQESLRLPRDGLHSISTTSRNHGDSIPMFSRSIQR